MKRGFSGIRCISLYSYIKPQHFFSSLALILAVYPYIPTSNRNIIDCCLPRRCAVYPYIPTSNRNKYDFKYGILSAVYPYIPTSNRNIVFAYIRAMLLYILIFLHQTATPLPFTRNISRCISLYSYIKPQLSSCL